MRCAHPLSLVARPCPSPHSSRFHPEAGTKKTGRSGQPLGYRCQHEPTGGVGAGVGGGDGDPGSGDGDGSSDGGGSGDADGGGDGDADGGGDASTKWCVMSVASHQVLRPVARPRQPASLVDTPSPSPHVSRTHPAGGLKFACAGQPLGYWCQHDPIGGEAAGGDGTSG